MSRKRNTHLADGGGTHRSSEPSSSGHKNDDRSDARPEHLPTSSHDNTSEEIKANASKQNNNLSNGCVHLSVGTAQREEASKSSSGTKDGSWSDGRPGHLSGDRVRPSRDVAVARLAVARVLVAVVEGVGASISSSGSKDDSRSAVA